MNCDRCPHLKRIVAAMRPCQLCEAGKLHGQVSVDAAPSRELVYQHRKVSDHTPTDGVTNLAPADEDKLRRAMATLFALDPIDLMLVAHLAAQRPMADFGRVMDGVDRTIRSYHGRTGAMAFARKERIVAKMPALRAILRTEAENDTVGRIAKELEL